MQAYELPEERWAFKLAPQLVGKAQQAYAALNPDDAKDYVTLKKAILLHYINESYQQRFRERMVKLIENSLLGYRIWQISGHRDVTQKRAKGLDCVGTVVIHFTKCTYMGKGRKPKTSTEAGSQLMITPRLESRTLR